MSKKLMSIICLLILSIVSFSLQVIGQTNETEIRNKKVEINITDATLLQVASTLSVNFRVPIGLELVVDSRSKAKKNIIIKSGSLSDIMDSLVSQEPDYRWEIRNGVVNIFPVNSKDEFVGKLLETHIAKFNPAEGLDKFQIRDTVADLPEVVALLKANNIESLNRSYPYRPSIYANDKVELGISDTNVRGVLNKVVKDSEHKIWVVERIGENKEFLLISL